MRILLVFIVRFPSGVSITYNGASHLVYEERCRELYARKPKNAGTCVAYLYCFRLVRHSHGGTA